MINQLFEIFIFPGFLFLGTISFIAEYLDRKFYARLQNRVGPPWFQPVADFIKLLAKEEIIPADAEPKIIKILPVVSLSSVITAFLYIPLWHTKALFAFNCDIIVIIYLLTIPTLTFFLAGWYSTSIYSMLGAVRTLTQLFAYEVLLFLSILSPALLADTWTLSAVTEFYSKNPLLCLLNIPAFIIAVISAQGKLEKVPFDIPEAETEIVAGTFTEYGGRLLALFRMTISSELIVISALLAAVFFPFGLGFNPVIGFLIFLFKMLIMIAILAIFRTIVARLRIDQMVELCWKVLAPLAILQLFLNLIIKEVFLK
ncbi:MAG: NADH-quinone oxidoreductase subunit H [Elusimicrobia bacterium]|nr:NADH-quinone oxidoreductase subunit H [Candidatus Liberimonas magnetica]